VGIPMLSAWATSLVVIGMVALVAMAVRNDDE
jgi:hypothetical protein